MMKTGFRRYRAGYNLKIRAAYFVLVEQVDTPNGAYIGQKLTKLVSKNTPAKTSSTIPKVPEMIL